MKSKQDTTGSDTARNPRSNFAGYEDEERYMDRSGDHVARVRAAREVAQREMESFGDVSEYDISIIQGQTTEEPVVRSQSSLEFQPESGKTT